MRTIINYTSFKSNEEFVKWQMEGEKKQVHQVQPQLMEIDLDITELNHGNGKTKNASGSGVPGFGIFVTYLTEVEENIEDEPSN